VSDEIVQVRRRIDEGVPIAELQPQALQQLAALVREQVAEANTVRKIAEARQSLVLAEGRSHAQRLQVRAVTALDHGDFRDAWDDVQASALITSVLLQQAPGDMALRLQLGMIFKTTAQILEASGEDDRAQTALADAERLFELVRTETPSGSKTVLDLANAVHGMGNVYALRHQPDRAIELYRLALQLEPDHVFALHDIFAALYAKAEAGQVDVDGMAAALRALEAKVAELEARNGRAPISAERLQALEEALDYWRSKQAGAAPDHARV
jgi:tetratricopeptide (TPR) repeat protein